MWMTTTALHAVSAPSMSEEGTRMGPMAPDNRLAPLVGRADELSELSEVLLGDEAASS